jgi:hypothetical protein
MPHPVRLLTTLFAIVLVSYAHVAMATDHAMRTTTGQQPRQERAGQPMRSALALSSATLAGDPAAVGQSTHRPQRLDADISGGRRRTEGQREAAARLPGQ